MDKDLFDDLMASCNEVLAHKRGELQLKTTTLEIPDDELEPSQLLFQKIERLPEPDKQKAILYVDELLQVAVG